MINDVEDEGGVTGIRTDSLALVAVKPGVYDLPPVTLSWWDTQADRQRQVRLPGRQLRVSPGAAGPGAATPDPAAISSDTSTRSAPAAAGPGWLPWLTAALGLGWLATALGWFLSGRGSRPSKHRAEQRHPGSPKAVLEACRRNDAVGAQKALRAWLNANGHHGPLHSWDGAQDRAAYENAIDGMERALYSREGGDWDGSALASAIQALRSAGGGRAGETEDSALPPLFPSR